MTKQQLSDYRNRAARYLLCELFDFLNENSEVIGAEKCDKLIADTNDGKKDALAHYYKKYQSGSLKI